LLFELEEDRMIDENDATAGDFSPEQLLAEMEARIREIEAAGGEAPSVIKCQLERVKRRMAGGGAQGIQFMKAGDQNSGIMGFSLTP
jgi:hypothetical protein